MADYYVKTGGNDSSAGTSDGTAWANSPDMAAWSGGANPLQSGDTVYFRSQDTWSVAAPVFDSTTAGVTYNGDTYGTGTRATFQTTSSMVDHGGVVNIYRSNITFKGFEVDSNSQWCSGISVGWGATSNFGTVTIDNCDVHGFSNVSWGYGIIVSGWDSTGITVSDITIQNSAIHDNDNEGIAFYDSWTAPNNNATGCKAINCSLYNNQQGIIVAGNHDNVVIEDCDIYSNTTGIWQRTTDQASGTPDNLIVRRNLIHGNGVGYRTFTHAANVTDRGMSATVYNNLFYNQTGDAELMIPHGDYNVGWFRIYNNTFYNTKAGSYGLIAICPYSDAVTDYPTVYLANNIFYAGNEACLYSRWALADITTNNNLYYRTSGAGDAHIVDPLGTSYTRSQVTNYEATAQNTDPLFVDAGNADFSTTGGSPVVGNGVDLSAYFTDDYAEVTRPRGLAWDIGAYEFLMADLLRNGSTHYWHIKIKDADGNESGWSLTANFTMTTITASGTPSIEEIDVSGTGLYASVERTASGTPSVPEIDSAGVATKTVYASNVTAGTPTLGSAGIVAVGEKIAFGTAGAPTLGSAGTVVRGLSASGAITIDEVSALGVAKRAVIMTGTPSIQALTTFGYTPVNQGQLTSRARMNIMIGCGI